MDIKSLSDKVYGIPKNSPMQNSHRYQEVINLGYAKYLDIIYHCGRFAMVQQFYQLLKLFEGKERTDESNATIGNNMLQRLIELGFVGSEFINVNKFIYLKHPSIALVAGDYRSAVRTNVAQELKNSRFKIAILNIDYFLHYGQILHSSIMFRQLQDITKDILIKIRQTGNKYRYATACIEDILKLGDYLEIKNYLERFPEYEYKLDIVRGIWTDLALLYRKLIMQHQFITSCPAYYKLFAREDGRINLHYVPNVIIFDVAHDERFYNEKSTKLFHAFYSIEGNELRESQKSFIASGGTSLGSTVEHRIGYRMLIIGDDIEVLNAKKRVVDRDVGASISSPLMDYAEVAEFPVAKYYLHGSRKGNKFANKQNERLDKEILGKIQSIQKKASANSHNKKFDDKAKINEQMLDLIN